MTTRISAKLVQTLLIYDETTGHLNWRQTGVQAGWIEPKGYRRVCIGGRNYLAHRLAWLYMTGQWPIDQIDHINLNRADNRWNNLREASNSQNQANRGPTIRSTSGIKGVYWHKRLRRWQVAIMKNGRLICVGYRDDKGVAAALYAVAAKKHFGKYARAS